MTVLTTQGWLDGGKTRAQLRTALLNGQYERLRRGRVVEALPRSATETHRLKLSAAAEDLGERTFFAGESAAVLHGLPILAQRLATVVAVRTGGGHGAVTTTLHARRATLRADETTVVDGLPVTSLTRTVADLTRRLPFAEAVMVADAGLRQGVGRVELLAQTRQGRGCRMAERALRFADPRAESAGESLSRVRLAQAGLPAPDLQREIRAADGTVIARLDFFWDEGRLAGEFDGLVKYGRLIRPGQTPEQVIAAEKRREQRLFDLRVRVVRWVWADLWTPDLGRRVRAALHG